MLRSPSTGSNSHEHPSVDDDQPSHLLCVSCNTDTQSPCAALGLADCNSCVAVDHPDAGLEDVRNTCRTEDVDINLDVADVAAAVG